MKYRMILVFGRPYRIVFGVLIGTLLWFGVVARPAQAAGTTWTVTIPSDVETDGDLVAHTGSLRFVLAHAASGDQVVFGDMPVDTIHPFSTLVVPSGVTVGWRRDQPCGSYLTPLINIDAARSSLAPVVSLGAGATLRNVNIGGGKNIILITGADVDVCGVGLGLLHDSDGNPLLKPPGELAAGIDAPRAVIHQSYLHGPVVLSAKGSDSRIGNAVGGSGDGNDGTGSAMVSLSADSTMAAQRVTVRDPFPRSLRGMVGFGVFGGDDVPNHTNHWAETPVILRAYSYDDFLTVRIEGKANPFSLVDIYFDDLDSIVPQAPVYADATGQFVFSGELSGASLIVTAGSTLADPAHRGRVGSSSQLSGPVAVTEDDAPTTLLLSGAQLLFSEVRKTTVPVAQALAVIVPPAAPAMAWQVAATTAGGGNWLSVAPGSGSGNGSFNVSITNSDLATGLYTGTVTVSETANPSNKVTANVLLDVRPRGAILLSKQQLTFRVVQNGTLPVAQLLNLTAPITVPTMAWQASATTDSGGDWLSVTPNSGSGNGALTVSVTKNNLAAGTYTGSVVVKDVAEPTNVSQTQVSIEVQPSWVEVSPATLKFSGMEGSGLSPAKTLNVAVAPSGTAWEVLTTTDAGGNWLHVTPTGGAGGNTLSVTIDTGGLAVGSYTGMVTVRDVASLGRQGTTQVTLTVTPSGLALTPDKLNFSQVQGGGLPASKTLNVSAASAAVAWDVVVQTQSGGDWLDVSPTQGNGNGTLELSIKANDLAVGTYSAVVNVLDVARPNGPVSTLVTLLVVPPTGPTGEVGVINSVLQLVDFTKAYDPVDPRAAAGVFTITATFENISTLTFDDVVMTVNSLTSGNLVVNADDGPGAAGAMLTVAPAVLGENGVLDPDESVTVDFAVGLAEPVGFTLAVDVLASATPGVVNVAGGDASDESFVFVITTEDLNPFTGLYLPVIDHSPD